MKKNLVQLALNPFFGWLQVPEKPISGTGSITSKAWLEKNELLFQRMGSEGSTKKKSKITLRIMYK